MRFAVKKLTRSDLTFFEYQFRRQNVSNQKSINLNRDVFVDLIFPTAGQVTGGVARQFTVPVILYGPGMRSQQHRITRKVIAAGGSQKNWRLNGEFVPGPEFDPTRYHGLERDDFVVFGFDGANGLPTAVYMVLLSHSEPDDAPLINQVTAIARGRSMAEVTMAEMQTIVQASPASHPIRELLEAERDEALQEAALGSAAGAEKLLRNPSARRMSAEALARARLAAEDAGRNGEVLIDIWLRREVRKGRLADAVWMSETNAINPWDFEVTELSGTVVRIEVKSTTGPFERDLHISQSEVLSAAQDGAARTELWRVFAISSDGGWFQINRDIRSFARAIRAATSSLPAGVIPDGYSIRPSSMGTWTDAVQLNFDEDEE